MVLSESHDIQLIGQSEAIHFIDAEISLAARCTAKVFITGDTGVEKGVAARLIHQRSARRTAPFMVLNCAGVPDPLLESELFGHERGSFRGACRTKTGLLERAANGTLFMDEIGEMSRHMQELLVRFLETSEIQRVGANRAHARVDVRLITATNRDLETHIASGAFRDDLYFRLNVIRLVIPPLRERLEDVPLLIDYLLTTYSEWHRTGRPHFSDAALNALVAYSWPGNLRELENVIERIVLCAAGRDVTPADLPANVFPHAAAAAPPAVVPAAPRLIAEDLAMRMIANGESFWDVVYPEVVARNLLHEDLRTIVGRGLELTNGNYRALVHVFNMPPDDYRRFRRFLREHRCNLPVQPYRDMAAVHAFV